MTVGGRYAVNTQLGVGGMSLVYDAVDSWSGRRIALKVLNRELATNREVVGRFIQEAQAVASLSHPNIVEVLDYGHDPGLNTYFIAQEFLDGMDLARWTERCGAIPPGEAVGIACPIMSALVAVHARGIVHRDIKPENVFLAVGSDGAMVPKLIDFGVSKVYDGALGPNGRTRAGIAIGTPEYMSPEQARGDQDLDARSDVWSMGVMLYQLLSGRTPFEADSQTMLLVAIITEAPVPIEHVMPGLPPALCEVVHRALQPDRSRRIQSMQELLDAVLSCPVDVDSPFPSERPEGSATSISLPSALSFGIEPLQRAEPPREPVGAPTPMHWTPSAELPATAAPARRKGPLVALLGFFVVAVVLGATMIHRRGPGEASSSPSSAGAPAPEVPAPAPEAPAPAPAPEITSIDARRHARPGPAAVVHRRRRIERRPRNNAPILAP